MQFEEKIVIHKGIGTKGQPIIRGEASHIYIGNYCSISNYAIFDAGCGHHSENVSQYDFTEMGVESKYHPKTKGDIKVGNDVYIGDNAMIMSGVEIGDGAVVAAGAIVTKNVDPYTVVAGVPAMPKKYRFSQSQIEALLEIKWWNWPLEKIIDNIELIGGPNVEEFITLHQPIMAL